VEIDGAAVAGLRHDAGQLVLAGVVVDDGDLLVDELLRLRHVGGHVGDAEDDDRQQDDEHDGHAEPRQNAAAPAATIPGQFLVLVLILFVVDVVLVVQVVVRVVIVLGRAARGRGCAARAAIGGIGAVSGAAGADPAGVVVVPPLAAGTAGVAGTVGVVSRVVGHGFSPSYFRSVAGGFEGGCGGGRPYPVVPPAIGAYFDDLHCARPVFSDDCVQFTGSAGRPGAVPQIFSENPGYEAHVIIAT